MGVQGPIWHLASEAELVGSRQEAGGLAQSAEAIFALGPLPSLSFNSGKAAPREADPRCSPFGREGAVPPPLWGVTLI